MNSGAGLLAVFLSLFVAMILSVFHLPEWAPDWLAWFRPSWTVLVLFYWVMEFPQRIGMIRAWILGLIMDVLLGAPLGVNAICLAALTYATWSFYERLRMYAVPQQAVVIFAMVFVLELFKTVLMVQFEDTAFQFTFLWVASSSLVVWPLVYLALRSSTRSSGF